MEVQNDEISLRELIEKGKEWYAYLLSQWKIIVLAGIIGACLGLAYSFIKKPIIPTIIIITNAKINVLYFLKNLSLFTKLSKNFSSLLSPVLT